MFRVKDKEESKYPPAEHHHFIAPRGVFFLLFLPFQFLLFDRGECHPASHARLST